MRRGKQKNSDFNARDGLTAFKERIQFRRMHVRDFFSLSRNRSSAVSTLLSCNNVLEIDLSRLGLVFDVSTKYPGDRLHMMEQ